MAKNEEKLRAKLPVILDEINSAFGIRFPQNTPVLDMISTLSSLMAKPGIVRITGKGHHKSSYQKALEKLEEYAEKTSRYELYNSLFDGRNSFSKTDIDSTFMHMKDDHMKNGQLKPGYNIQAAVEGEYILGIDVSSERSDVNTLIPFLEKFNSLELFVLKNIICDAGYESEENYLYLKSHNLTSYIKPANYEQQKKKNYRTKYGRIENMEYHEIGDIFVCKAGYFGEPEQNMRKTRQVLFLRKQFTDVKAAKTVLSSKTAQKQKAIRRWLFHTASETFARKVWRTLQRSWENS